MSFWWCDLPPSAHLYTSLYTTNGQPCWPFFYMQFPPFTFLSGQLWAGEFRQQPAVPLWCVKPVRILLLCLATLALNASTSYVKSTAPCVEPVLLLVR